MVNKKKIPIEISNRHVHLSRRDIDALFGKDYKLNVFRHLSQPEEFAAEEQITLVHRDKRIENVRVLGPERDETQVELLRTDTINLGIDAPVRESNNIEETPGITLEGPKGNVILDRGVILAKRHLHASEEEARILGLKNGQFVSIRIPENETLLDNILVRINPKYRLAVHIDADEGKKITKKTFGELI